MGDVSTGMTILTVGGTIIVALIKFVPTRKAMEPVPAPTPTRSDSVQEDLRSLYSRVGAVENRTTAVETNMSNIVTTLGQIRSEVHEIRKHQLGHLGSSE